MRLFGSDNISGIMDRLGLEEDQPIEHRLISRALENAQRKVEARNFEIRKRLLRYDDILNEQRRVIYSQRQQILQDDELKAYIMRMTEDLIAELLQVHCPEDMTPEHWNYEGLLAGAQDAFLAPNTVSLEQLVGLDRDKLRAFLLERAHSLYREREEALGEGVMRSWNGLLCWVWWTVSGWNTWMPLMSCGRYWPSGLWPADPFWNIRGIPRDVSEPHCPHPGGYCPLCL